MKRLIDKDLYQDVLEANKEKTRKELRREKVQKKLSALQESLTANGEYGEIEENWNPDQEMLEELSNNPNVKITKAKKTPFLSSQLKMCNTLTCGACEGLNVRPIKFKAVTCSKEGFTETSRICNHFTPDPIHSVSYEGLQKENHALQQFGDILTGFPSEKLGLLMGLLFCEKKTRTFGFRFFQKVYYRWRGTNPDNFYNNFVVGYVVDVTKSRIRLTTRTGSCAMVISIDGDQTIFDGNGPTLYTEEGFEKYKSFIKGKEDPLPTTRLVRSANRDLVLTIDDLNKFGDSDASRSPDFVTEKSPRGRKKVRDLVDILGEMSRTYNKVNMRYYDEPEQEEPEVAKKVVNRTIEDDSPEDLTSLEELRETESLLDTDDEEYDQ